MRTRNLFFVALLSTIVPACGSPAGVQTTDATREGKSDSLSSTSSYYTVREETRGSPRLEGLFVRRVNSATTRCADGKDAPECYVAAENYDSLNLSASQHAALQDAMARGEVLVRATLKAKTAEKLGTASELIVTEAWQAQSPQAAGGSVYLVRDSGLRCITYPCGSFVRETLNSTASETIADVDFSSVGDEKSIDLAFAQLYSDGGVLVAGTEMEVTGPAGTLPGLKASLFYLRISGAGCRSDSDCAQPLCLPGPCPSFACNVSTRECEQTSCPDPSDPKVHYVGDSHLDPSVCTAVLFTCMPKQTLFSGGCGCGCID